MPDSASTIDHRHAKRIKLMQYLFAAVFDQNRVDLKRSATKQQPSINFQHKLSIDEPIWKEVELIVDELESIDIDIQKYAPERPLLDINQVDLAILRLIVWEANHKKTPKKVLIDEAVELAKEFGSDSSPRFVNGVLGKLFADDLLSNTEKSSE